jgi:hypothetical protein
MFGVFCILLERYIADEVIDARYQVAAQADEMSMMAREQNVMTTKMDDALLK